LPFQVSLGAMIPIWWKNLILENRDIGTIHITTECYRLYPVEWNIDKSADMLTIFCLNHQLLPRQV